MSLFVIVAAMLFCAPLFAQGVKLRSVTNSIGMELIEIPAGKFTMACIRRRHRWAELHLSFAIP
ncbi:MAG: hypothetical protein WCR23_14160 [Planctomycetota bacterium]